MANLFIPRDLAHFPLFFVVFSTCISFARVAVQAVSAGIAAHEPLLAKHRRNPF